MIYKIMLKLAISAFLGCYQVAGQAQESKEPEGKGELAISYGVGSSNFKTGPYERWNTRGFFSGNVTLKNTRTTEVFRITAKGDIYTRQTIGLTVAFEANEKEVYRLDQLIGSLSTAYFILAFDWEYNFIKNNWIRIYAGASFGVGYVLGTIESTRRSRQSNELITQEVLSYQGTIFGIRLGKTIAIIAEFGYGYKGNINGGVSYRF